MTTLRAGLAGRSARAIPTDVLGWAGYVLVVLLLILSDSTFMMYLAGLAIVYAISALGLDWIQGRAGQVSIGSAAFMAIGAYIAASFAEQGVPFPVAMVVAAMGGALVGFIVGLPALRLRGLYLALSTLALQFITAAVAVFYEGWSHHSAGFNVAPISIGPVILRYGPSWLITLAVVLALVIIGLRNLYKTAPGRAWLTIKESQMAAAVIGLNPTRWKLLAFVASSGLISFSGALLAYYTLIVASETYTLTFSISFVAMVIIGGIGSIPGVILGAVLVTVSPYALSGLTAQLPTDLPFAKWLNDNVFFINAGLYGVIVLLVLLYQPRGLAGAIEAGRRRWANRGSQGSGERRAHAVVPAVAPPAGIEASTAAAAPDRVGAPSAAAAAATAASAGALDLPVDLAEIAPETALLEFSPTAIRREEREAAAANEPPVLHVKNLRIVYRTGACAVDGIDLDVRPGEVVALLGRNGAGKTSTLRAISGFFNTEGVRLTGEVSLNGREIRGQSPVTTARQGVVLVPERDKVFPNLTVDEHIRLVRAHGETLEEVRAMFPPLTTRASSLAGLLSGGERQMLALARAFLMQPRLLLIDEMSLGLAPAVIKRLIQAVRQLQEKTGISILIVEQNIGAALELADRVYVLEAGQIVGSGHPADVSREAIVASSLGI